MFCFCIKFDYVYLFSLFSIQTIFLSYVSIVFPPFSPSLLPDPPHDRGASGQWLLMLHHPSNSHTGDGPHSHHQSWRIATHPNAIDEAFTNNIKR